MIQNKQFIWFILSQKYIEYCAQYADGIVWPNPKLKLISSLVDPGMFDIEVYDLKQPCARGLYNRRLGTFCRL